MNVIFVCDVKLSWRSRACRLSLHRKPYPLRIQRVRHHWSSTPVECRRTWHSIRNDSPVPGTAVHSGLAPTLFDRMGLRHTEVLERDHQAVAAGSRIATCTGQLGDESVGLNCPLGVLRTRVVAVPARRPLASDFHKCSHLHVRILVYQVRIVTGPLRQTTASFRPRRNHRGQWHAARRDDR